MNYSKHTRGFIALMSVIIISAILSVLIFTLGASTFFSRFDVLDTETKRVSLGLAEGCVDVAMLKLAQNQAMTQGDCVNFDNDPPTYTCDASTKKICKICTNVSAAASLPVSLQVRGLHSGAYTNLSVTIDKVSGVYSITDWSETASGNPGCTIP